MVNTCDYRLTRYEQSPYSEQVAAHFLALQRAALSERLRELGARKVGQRLALEARLRQYSIRLRDAVC